MPATCTHVKIHVSALLDRAKIVVPKTMKIFSSGTRTGVTGLRRPTPPREYYCKNRCSVPPECDPVPGCFCTGDTGAGGTGQWSLAAVVISHFGRKWLQQIDS